MNNTGILNRPLQHRSVVQKITDQITRAILEQELRPGDRLPTETELCASMGVGRNSVREAIKILEAYGVVEIRRADGTYVCDHYTEKMLDPMLYGILLMQCSITEIIQLRRVLDIGILQNLMQTVTTKQLETLEQSCDCLAAECALSASPVSASVSSADAERKRRIMEADIQFHLDLVRLTGNELLQTVYHYVDRITTPSRLQALEVILSTVKLEEFIQLHRQMIKLLRDRRTEDIPAVLEAHYSFWKQAAPHDQNLVKHL